jgi:hypothetical protein
MSISLFPATFKSCCSHIDPGTTRIFEGSKFRDQNVPGITCSKTKCRSTDENVFAIIFPAKQDYKIIPGGSQLTYNCITLLRKP